MARLYETADVAPARQTGAVSASDEPGEPRLFCVIVTYRRHFGLARTLDLALGQRLAAARVVVVDNEDSPLVRAIVEERQGAVPIDYLASGDNRGPAGGTADAMRHIVGLATDLDWITRLDDDLETLEPDIFEQTLQFATSMIHADPMVAAVGAVGARYDWRRGRLVRIDDGEIGTHPIPVDYVPTNVFPAFRVEAVRKIGVLNSALFYGFSEVEYGLRLRRAGRTLYANPVLWARLGRRSAATSGPRAALRPMNWRRYYSLRNQVYVLRRYGHPVVALRVALVRGVAKPALNMVVAPRQAWRHLRLGLRAGRDGWSGRLGRTIEPNDLD